MSSLEAQIQNLQVGTAKWVQKSQNGCITPVSENRLKMSNLLNKPIVFIEKRNK